MLGERSEGADADLPIDARLLPSTSLQRDFKPELESPVLQAF